MVCFGIGKWYSLSEWNVLGEGDGSVVELFVVVHPDLGGATSVTCEHVAAASGEGVGVAFPEDVADLGRKNDIFVTMQHKVPNCNVMYHFNRVLSPLS